MDWNQLTTNWRQQGPVALGLWVYIVLFRSSSGLEHFQNHLLLMLQFHTWLSQMNSYHTLTCCMLDTCWPCIQLIIHLLLIYNPYIWYSMYISPHFQQMSVKDTTLFMNLFWKPSWLSVFETTCCRTHCFEQNPAGGCLWVWTYGSNFTWDVRCTCIFSMTQHLTSKSVLSVPYRKINTKFQETR